MFGTPNKLFRASPQFQVPDPQMLVSPKALAEMLADLMALGMSGGPGWSTSRQGLSPIMPLSERLFVIIDGNNGASGHSWSEAHMVFPPTATRVVSGRRGTIRICRSGSSFDAEFGPPGPGDPILTHGPGEGASGSGPSNCTGKDDQVAWSYNGNNYERGAVVEIVRVSFEAWAIVEGAAISVAGSGPERLGVDCGDGVTRIFNPVTRDGVLTAIPEGGDDGIPDFPTEDEPPPDDGEETIQGGGGGTGGGGGGDAGGGGFGGGP